VPPKTWISQMYTHKFLEHVKVGAGRSGHLIVVKNLGSLKKVQNPTFFKINCVSVLWVSARAHNPGVLYGGRRAPS